MQTHTVRALFLISVWLYTRLSCFVILIVFDLLYFSLMFEVNNDLENQNSIFKLSIIFLYIFCSIPLYCLIQWILIPPSVSLITTFGSIFKYYDIFDFSIRSKSAVTPNFWFHWIFKSFVKFSLIKGISKHPFKSVSALCTNFYFSIFHVSVEVSNTFGIFTMSNYSTPRKSQCGYWC